jgi:hypothetical protein
MTCAACGSTNLVEGDLSDSNGDGVRFRPAETPRLKRAFGIGNRKVKAFACLSCHHMQFAVEFTESDRTERQTFEGHRPSVVELLAESDEK